MVQQLSVFIENKSGTLLEVFDLLKKADVQLVATTIADTLDYGICRIICNKPKEAYQMLKENGVSVSLNEIFAIGLSNQPGSAADAIATFAKEGVGIIYLYSFLLGGHGILIFRTDDCEKAKQIIAENNLKSMDEKSLESLL